MKSSCALFGHTLRDDGSVLMEDDLQVEQMGPYNKRDNLRSGFLAPGPAIGLIRIIRCISCRIGFNHILSQEKIA